MPHPLSRVKPDANIAFGNAGDRPLQRHPDLAALAIEAIASWANVENFMLKLFVEMFGGNESLATNIYLALENQAAKNAAISAAAKTTLGEDSREYSVFKAIISLSKTNEKSRNKLVHWTWGDSPNIPDGLLLIDPLTTIGELDRSDVYVYKQADFQSIIEANDKLCGLGLRFTFILKGHVANREGRLLEELMEDPDINSRLR